MAKSYLKEKYRKPGNVYVGVVSRLDSFVSGVIVMARTSKAAGRLSRQFAESRVAKEYLAIVSGDAGIASGTIRQWLVKDEAQHRVIPVHSDRAQQVGAKLAVLHFQKLGVSGGHYLLRVVPETGRKHQIRVQLASQGSPIVGDRKYGSEQDFPRGIALHCQSLALIHPTRGTEMSFRIEPPSYWELSRFLAEQS
jgi:23S rRNA pseudouridine1911/1915/1917 synthase